METNLRRTPRDRGRELRVTSLFGAVTEDSSSVETPTIADHQVLSDERWPRSVADFERPVDRFQHELVRFAFCRLRNRPDAEDVVQDVLLKTLFSLSCGTAFGPSSTPLKKLKWTQPKRK
jgi:hypothetical protein